MKGRKSLLLLSAATMLYWITMYTYVPILPGYSQAMGANAQMIGLIAGSYGFMQMALRFPLGLYSDRLRRRKLFIVAGTLTGLLSAVGLYLSTAPVALLVFRGLSGVSACAYVIITIQFAEYTQRGSAMGNIAAISSLAQVIGMLLGGLVGSVFGDRATFLAAIGAGMLGVAVAALCPDTPIQTNTAPRTHAWGALRSRALISASVLAVCSQAIQFGKAFAFSPIAAELYSASAFEKSLLTLFTLLPSALLSSFWGRWALPRLGTRTLVCVGFAIQALSCAMMPFTNSLHGLYASQIVTGIGVSLAFPALMARSISDAAPQYRATAMGFFQAVYGLGMFAGPWLTGICMQQLSLNAAFWFNAGIGLLAAVLAVLLIGRHKPAGNGLAA